MDEYEDFSDCIPLSEAELNKYRVIKLKCDVSRLEAELELKYIPWRYTQNMLAQEYGVSQMTINLIINNKSWVE